MSLQTHLGDRVDVKRQKRFTAAHAACHDAVYRYFRRRTTNPSTAEDLCAEVFRITWEKSAHEDQDLSAMVLFGIAHNVLRNHMRSSARSANLLSSLLMERMDLGQDHGTDADASVRDALDQLKPDDREVLLLTYWDGFTSSEVSDLLNTSATAVRMRLHRARKALGHLLQRERESQESQR
ncbi:RNA polymerase sigma factor [Paenarthrobacter sp. A20]|uniref:RNA polymerase sigma factor n=1 Tax=Paenarthrobacter sp. A20 TaxID=2817891 RepID=UPI00209D87AA|nr:RNA polymerase sigma factor [Paenarthrobacter sp. A20]MCP1411951.1 RNA polymerase sigma-70 factor (ECF subfamily) [Paenarthrobacter sp. A20]